MTAERSYTIQLRPEPEGGFTVRVPALPEIVTYGIDEEEALRMAEEAIELALEVRQEDGDEIPADVVPLTRTLTIRTAARRGAQSQGTERQAGSPRT